MNITFLKYENMGEFDEILSLGKVVRDREALRKVKPGR